MFYANDESLKNHITKIHGAYRPETLFLCPDCSNYRSNSAKDLVRHWQNGCIKPSCRLCGKKFLRCHTRYNHQIACKKGDRPFGCDQCSYSAHSNAHLMRHVHLVHEKNGGPCELSDCAICPDLLKRRIDSKPKGNHSDVVVKKCSTIARKPYSQRKTNNATLCLFPKCEFQAANPETLAEHVKNTHHVLSTNDTKSGPFGLGRDLRAICELCGKVMRDRHGITGHGISAHGLSSDYMCDICDKSFTRPLYLKVNKREHHQANKPSSDKAEKPSSADMGESSSEDSSKLHKCDICKFKTKYPGNLIKHKRSVAHKKAANEYEEKRKTSTTATVHSCPLCDYQTPPGTWYRTLQRHLYSQHLRKGEAIPAECDVKLAKCRLCDYTALEESRITRHMKRHVSRGETIPDEYVALEIVNT